MIDSFRSGKLRVDDVADLITGEVCNTYTNTSTKITTTETVQKKQAKKACKAPWEIKFLYGNL